MDKQLVQIIIGIAGSILVVGSGLIALSYTLGTQEARTESSLENFKEDLEEAREELKETREELKETRKDVDGLQGTVNALQEEREEGPATSRLAATATGIREPGQAITFSNSGHWGRWSDPQYCPRDYYVCGLKQRVETPQGGDGDDTAMNAVAFYCCPLTPSE